MPITITTNQFKFKDPNTGQYRAISAVADESLEERLEAIESAGNTAVSAVTTAQATAVSAIDSKKAEAVASVADAAEVQDMVAEVFDVTKNYSTGDYVIYETSGVSKLYRFTADHAAGAWSGTDAVEVALAGEVGELKSAIIQPSTLTWEQGAYAWASGNSQTSDSRIRSPKISKSGLIKAECADGFTFAIFAWNGDIFVGDLKTDGTFAPGATGTPTVAWVSKYSFENAPNYTFAFVMQKTSGDAVPADGANFLLEYNRIDVIEQETDEKIDDLSDDVDGIQSDVSNLSNKIDLTQEQLADGAAKITTPKKWLNGHLSVAEGEPVSSLSAIYTPDYYLLSSGIQMAFTGLESESITKVGATEPSTVTMRSYAYFYNAAKQFISPRVSTFIVPEGALYVRFTYAFTNSSCTIAEYPGGLNAFAGKWSVSCSTENERDMSFLKSAASTVLSGDVCPHPAGDAQTGDTTINGVAFTKLADDSYHITGTSTGESSSDFRLYRSFNTMPSGIIPGKTYYADYYCDLFGCNLEIVAYASGSGGTTIFQDRIPGTFTVPSNTVGMIIKYHVGVGVTIDSTVCPRIFDVESTQYAMWHKAKRTRPMLSIIYDDGFLDFKTYIMPVITAKNVPIATAVMPEVVGTYNYVMTWDDIQYCYNNGAEVLTHFGAYPEADWNSFGTQAVSRRYQMCRNQIMAHGMYTPNVLVFSGSSSRYNVSRKAAMRIFDAGFNASSGGINFYGKFDPYFINRYGADNETLDQLKAWIDELVAANDGWMVWTRHNGSNFEYGVDAAYAAQVLSDAIDYALSKGVQIVTVERGLNEYLDM